MENLSQNQYNYFFGGINTMHSPHKHTNRCFPFTVVVHVNEGQYLCYYKDKIIVANSGETLVVPEYVLHDIEMKEYGYLSWAHICAHINGNDILEGYDSPFIIGSAFSNYFKTFLNALNNTKIESLSLQALKKDYYISKLFILILENSGKPLKKIDKHWQQEIKNYITTNISKKFTIKELAVYSNMSVSSFCHKFHLEIGSSPIKYIICQKINASLSMLKNGDTISCIAQKLGFANEYYYSRQFKKVTGLTPSEYRRKF